MYANVGTLGDTGQEMHEKAKRLLAKWEALYKQAERIKNDEAVKEIMDKVGKGDKDDSPRYYWNEVKQYIAEAEGYVPINYAIWEKGVRAANRLKGFDSAIKNMEPLITDYVRRFGLMPEGQKSQVIEKEKIVEKIVEGEFLGLPTKTWLYISGGVAAAGVLTAVIVAATKPAVRARPKMAGMGHCGCRGYQ